MPPNSASATAAARERSEQTGHEAPSRVPGSQQRGDAEPERRDEHEAAHRRRDHGDGEAGDVKVAHRGTFDATWRLRPLRGRHTVLDSGHDRS